MKDFYVGVVLSSFGIYCIIRKASCLELITDTLRKSAAVFIDVQI